METRNLEKTAAAASSEEIQPLTLTRKTGKSCTYLYIKRMQDIVLSALALLLLSPLMLLLALAVVIDDPKGGPIFSQVRCGRGGEAFRLDKFRTMCVDAEKRLEELLPEICWDLGEKTLFEGDSFFLRLDHFGPHSACAGTALRFIDDFLLTF